MEKLYDFLLSNNLYIKQSYIRKKKINADIIILGNCIPATTLNPNDIEQVTHLKTYNLAQDHSNLTDNYLSYHIYLKNNKPAKFIILYLGPETFDNSLNKFNTFRFSNFLEDSIVSNTIRKSDLNFYKWCKIPFIKYGFYNNQIHFNALQGALHFLTKRDKILSENGYLQQNEKDAFLTTYNTGYKFKWDINQENQLLKLNSLALKSNTKVIFYESPMYIQKKSDLPNRTKILLKIEKLAKKLDRPYFRIKDTLILKTNFRTNVKLKGKAKINFNKKLANFLLKYNGPN
jgi:hypothetical protein